MMIHRRFLGRGMNVLSRAFFSEGLPRNGKPPAMKPFDPVEHGLEADFVLTNFTKMKG